MNRAELEAAEQMIMEECLTGGVALTSKWDTLHGKINFVKHIGLAQVMNRGQKEWVMKHHKRISLTIADSKTTFTIKGSRFNSKIWKGLMIKSKVHRKERVTSVSYVVTNDHLMVTIYHK